MGIFMLWEVFFQFFLTAVFYFRVELCPVSAATQRELILKTVAKLNEFIHEHQLGSIVYRSFAAPAVEIF